MKAIRLTLTLVNTNTAGRRLFPEVEHLLIITDAEGAPTVVRERDPRVKADTSVWAWVSATADGEPAGLDVAVEAVEI